MNASGMTLRDWFAGMALAEVPDPETPADAGKTAHLAYAIADAMMVHRRAGDGLHRLRVEMADAMLSEFPVFGSDGLNMLANAGLCTQDEAKAAIADARLRIAQREAADVAPLEATGEPISLEPAE